MRRASENIFFKAGRLLRTRPLQVLSILRMIALFYFARCIRAVFPALLQGVELGKNVRIQKNRSVMAEAPGARISISDHSIIYENARIEAYGSSQISIGRESILGDIRIVSRQGISIGERFLSSWNVFIQDFDPHPIDSYERSIQVKQMVHNFVPRFAGAKDRKEVDRSSWSYPGSPIEIGNDVWVGANATILKGAKIGDGCVVATGAVVLRGEYPAGSLIAGNPASVVRSIDSTQKEALVQGGV